MASGHLKDGIVGQKKTSVLEKINFASLEIKKGESSPECITINY